MIVNYNITVNNLIFLFLNLDTDCIDFKKFAGILILKKFFK